jgi:enoyl-[acyl-carrier protein] reductase II
MTKYIKGLRATRVLKSPFVEEILEVEKTEPSMEQLLPYIRGTKNKIAAIEGQIEKGWMNCGQGVGLIDSIPSAAEVVPSIVQEARRIADSLEI